MAIGNFTDAELDASLSKTASYDTWPAYATAEETLKYIQGFGRDIQEIINFDDPFKELTGGKSALKSVAGPPIVEIPDLQKGGKTYRYAYQFPNEDDPYLMDQTLFGKESSIMWKTQDFTIAPWRKVYMDSLWEDQQQIFSIIEALKQPVIDDHMRIGAEMKLSAMLGVDLLDYDGTHKIQTGVYSTNQLHAGYVSNVGLMASDGYLTTDLVDAGVAMGQAGRSGDYTQVNYMSDAVVGGEMGGTYDAVCLLHRFQAHNMAHYDDDFKNAYMTAYTGRAKQHMYLSGFGFAFMYLGVLYIILRKRMGDLLLFQAGGGYRSARYNGTVSPSAASKIVDASGTAYTANVNGATAILLFGKAMAHFKGKHDILRYQEKYDGVFDRIHTFNIEGNGLLKCRTVGGLTEGHTGIVLIHTAVQNPSQAAVI